MCGADYSTAGFGSVSSPWHNFTVKPRPVTDIDISRAQGGLDATNEMIETKRNRIRVLEKKLQEKKVVLIFITRSIRINADDNSRLVFSRRIDE
jgi:The Golgi pH Regulator (GPHR) Family N-terminal